MPPPGPSLDHPVLVQLRQEFPNVPFHLLPADIILLTDPVDDGFNAARAVDELPDPGTHLVEDVHLRLVRQDHDRLSLEDPESRGRISTGRTPPVRLHQFPPE